MIPPEDSSMVLRLNSISKQEIDEIKEQDSHISGCWNSWNVIDPRLTSESSWRFHSSSLSSSSSPWNSSSTHTHTLTTLNSILYCSPDTLISFYWILGSFQFLVMLWKANVGLDVNKHPGRLRNFSTSALPIRIRVVACTHTYICPPQQ